MKRSGGRLAAVALVFWLAAATSGCGGEPAEEQAPAEEVDLPPDAGFSLDDTSEPLPVTLEAVNESGVEGRATLIALNDSVQLSLMVQGLPADGEYQAHIHRGTCETGGAVVVGLNPVRAESDGMGRSLTTVPASRLPDEQPHFVQVHGRSGVLACGDVHGG